MPNSTHSRPSRIGIVGVGPRGLTVFERICANLENSAESGPVTVVLIDATCVGTGTVWRRNQPSHLLMNTVASQVTIFTDSSVEMRGPVVPGPSLYEWASYISKIAPLGRLSDQILAEARDMTPDSYPTRTFYGHYLRWVYEHIAARYVDVVEVVEITGAVIELCDDDHGRQRLTLEDGSVVADLDSVVLTQGHLGLQSEPDSEIHHFTDFADRNQLRYVAPGNAADIDLGAIPADEPVIVRGLGLTFFDYMTLLTVGRGGSFVTKDGQVKYVPSGREPILHAGSRRGIPYHSRGENQKGIDGRHAPFLLTQERIIDFRRRAAQLHDIDFRRDVWPLVAREVETVYYSLLIADRTSPREVRRFRNLYADCAPGSPAETDILNMFNIEGHLRWDWDRVLDPAQGLRFRDPISFHQWLVGYLNEDVRHAKLGNVHGAVKAALDVLRDLRNEVRLIVDHGGITGSSYRNDLDRWFTPSNAFLSIGPLPIKSNNSLR
ncbi:FAD/NAD(P)-binding protein [Rhodococcus qingshengii]|uniref:FAD/NAD(P)-binding protein n=1 Tax=Rhodococcus qingshengii TaxID=334542 RepID=UPI001BEAEAB7|nr:FAD/NAD(P)-binding protein [Rhodococcus qingshengii]MBT2275889.1 FAD/NAD(P)-binding protein [Rhodococcus qingshengii]